MKEPSSRSKVACFKDSKRDARRRASGPVLSLARCLWPPFPAPSVLDQSVGGCQISRVGPDPVDVCLGSSRWPMSVLNSSSLVSTTGLASGPWRNGFSSRESRPQTPLRLGGVRSPSFYSSFLHRCRWNGRRCGRVSLGPSSCLCAVDIDGVPCRPDNVDVASSVLDWSVWTSLLACLAFLAGRTNIYT